MNLIQYRLDFLIQSHAHSSRQTVTVKPSFPHPPARNLALGRPGIPRKSSSKSEYGLKLHCSSPKERGAPKAYPAVSRTLRSPFHGTPNGGH